MRFAVVVLLALTACPEPTYEPVDLTIPVPSGQSRAGIITDSSVLFGGISAEAQVGDYLLVNDRARFVVQAPRAGSFYFTEGGGLLDADIVRPVGEPGRDIVEEWREVLATARLNDVQTVSVTDSGLRGGAATVVVSGTDTGIDLIKGALEAEDFLESLGLTVTTEYRLPPDSWFLEVTTVITASEAVPLVDIGDIIIPGIEVADRWRPGAGMDTNALGPAPFIGAIAHQNDVAIMLATADGSNLGEPLPLLSELGDIDLGVGSSGSLEPGDTLRYERLYGVGPDMAALTDELFARQGIATALQDGMVTAGGEPVARARVILFADGEPYTVAATDEEGNWQASMPADVTVTTRAVGRSTGYITGLPGMTGHWSPFVSDAAGTAWLQALASDAPGAAEGFGVASEEQPLQLTPPALLTVRSADTPTFEVRALRTDGDTARDARFVPERTHGGAQFTAWARGGETVLPLEPGTYDILVHKGIRYEQDRFDITVVSGESLTLDAEIPQAYSHDGWLLGDPHQHASPSNDGNTTMEERLLVNAGRGIQLPFGTDHDRLADYNVLVEPLGLQGQLHSIVANEISSVRRGHVNAYPLVINADAPNNGAYLWYEQIPESTPDYIATARATYPGALLQMNHPFGSGIADAADYSTGRIGNPDFWSDDIDVIEVLNDGDYQQESALYLDLVSRGYPVSATGVSDAHGRSNSGIGFNGTFIQLGTNSVDDYTDDALVEALAAGRTIVTLGPYLDLSIMPGSRVVGATNTLDVTVLHPTWMDVDQVELYRDGMLVDMVEGTEASFALDPEIDAAYVVMARGDTRMELYNNTPPWAMSGAIFVDVDGNGWTPPLPRLATD